MSYRRNVRTSPEWRCMTEEAADVLRDGDTEEEMINGLVEIMVRYSIVGGFELLHDALELIAGEGIDE